MVRVRCYYILGIRKSTGRSSSAMIEAGDATAAKREFKRRHPYATVVRVNEREC